MSRWYCKEHKHLDKNPNRIITMYVGMKCWVEGCENKIQFSKKTNKTSKENNK